MPISFQPREVLNHFQDQKDDNFRRFRQAGGSIVVKVYKLQAKVQLSKYTSYRRKYRNFTSYRRKYSCKSTIAVDESIVVKVYQLQYLGPWIYFNGKDSIARDVLQAHFSGRILLVVKSDVQEEKLDGEPNIHHISELISEDFMVITEKNLTYATYYRTVAPCSHQVSLRDI